MKYGLLSYEFDPFFNIGDYVQSIAARQFLPRVDEFVIREKLNEYRGDKIRLIMNGWFMFQPQNWPPSEKIEPLFVAFHISPKYADAMLTKERVAYLKQHAPIGCRDISTLNLLEGRGVPAYYSGCLTLTLGRSYSWEARTENPILIADILYKAPTIEKNVKSFSKFYRAYRRGNLFRLDQSRKVIQEVLGGRGLKTKRLSCDIVSDSYPTPESRFKLAQNMLEEYSRAPLVITSRLHVALPCLAMGTPVIFMDGSLEAESDRARIDDVLPYFNLVKVGNKGIEGANFRLGEAIFELRNKQSAWEDNAERIAKRCEAFVR